MPKDKLKILNFIFLNIIILIVVFDRENIINSLVNIGGDEGITYLGKVNLEKFWNVPLNFFLGLMAVCWLWQFLSLQVDSSEIEIVNTKNNRKIWNFRIIC